MFPFNLKIDIEMPAGLDQWLKHDKPITDKLLDLTGDAELEVLSLEWGPSRWWDNYALQISEDIFQREIFMRSKERIYWYARSVIPRSCWEVAPYFFQRLEQESIRHLIFDEPQVELIERVIYPINDQCLEFHWVKKYLCALQGTLWVRLAKFSFRKTHSFYLIEILFPELKELINEG